MGNVDPEVAVRVDGVRPSRGGESVDTVSGGGRCAPESVSAGGVERDFGMMLATGGIGDNGAGVAWDITEGAFGVVGL